MDSSIYLGRQPILDKQERLYGYELLFRTSKTPNIAQVDDDSAATAAVITHAFSDLSLGDALDNKKIFINIGHEFLFSDVLEFLNPEQVILEILETIEITEKVVERCKELKQKGFTLALDDVVEITPEILTILPLVNIVKILLLEDWEEKVETAAKILKGSTVLLLAEHVETVEQFQKCSQAGFSLFQGYFFAHPTVLEGRSLSEDRATLLTLLNHILNDADIRILEHTFKNAPALSINLLRLTNSAGFGHHIQIISLRHAITILGRQHIQRWLQLLLFSSSDRHQQIADNPLLQLAATRAHLMENIVLSQKPAENHLAEQAFMVGIMSLVPVILGVSMENVLRQLSNLPYPVHDALLNRDGHLGKILLVVESLEGDTADQQLQRFTGLPKLSVDHLNHLHFEAIAWASRLGHPKDSQGKQKPGRTMASRPVDKNARQAMPAPL